MPPSLADELVTAYDALSVEQGTERLAIAVRSSATAEDTSDTSFAGMNASFTNVFRDDLVDRVLDCWVSLYGDRVMAYRAERGLTDEPAIAAIVQVMVPSERAGVMFTSADGRTDDLVIEGAFGLGEFVVAGTVEPDTYRVDRSTGLDPRHPHRSASRRRSITDAGPGSTATS